MVIICDDEVCCHASEGELYCWRFKGCTKGATPAKSKGSSRHLAGLAMEAANGFVSMDHGGADGTPPPNGGIISLTEMVTYCKDRAKGLDPVIPRHAQVLMRPGIGHEGWWKGDHKVMQMQVLGDIFNCVFNTALDLDKPIRVSELELALEASPLPMTSSSSSSS